MFVASGHSGGGTLVKIHPDQRGVTELWARKDLDNCHGGVMLLGGSLYGSACRSGGKKFFCADFLSGETKQADRTLGKLSLTYADGMLYGLSNTGQMLLLSRQARRIRRRQPLPRADGEHRRVSLAPGNLRQAALYPARQGFVRLRCR